MKQLLLLAALATALIAPARADYLIRDGNGNPLTVHALTLGAAPNQTMQPTSTPVDTSGTPYAIGNPLAVQFGTGIMLPPFAGSTGTDSSANGAAVPADSTFVLLVTIPVNATRARVGVQNQAAINLQVVRDDGAGANQTSLFLAGPFNSWESSTFKGRIRVYGPSGTAVAAYQD